MHQQVCEPNRQQYDAPGRQVVPQILTTARK